MEHFFTLIISPPRFNTTVRSSFLFHPPDIPLDLYWACLRSLLVTPSAYTHRDFYLPVPSTKEVLTKRVEFIKLKVQDDSEISNEYFTSKGIRLSIPLIAAFALSIENIFITEDYVGRMVGWLANFDIRRGLQIAQRIITSPILNISDLVSAYVTNQGFSSRKINIEKALLLGDYNYFYQQESSFILNLFEVDSNAITSPLLRLSILRLLIDVYAENTTDSEKMYSSVEDVLNYFEPTTVSRNLTKINLKYLLDHRLIEPYDPTDVCIYESQKIKITHCGRIHYEFVTEDKKGTYMSEMALITPVASQEHILKSRLLLKDIDRLSHSDLQNAINNKKIIKYFVEYYLEQDKIHMSLPKLTSYASQSNFRELLYKKWVENN